MDYPVINTRADLDAASPAPRAAFMSLLAGTLWRLEKDDDLKVWRAVEDGTTIARFGFTRTDFPSALPPDLPMYVLPTAEQIKAEIDQQRDAALDAGFMHNGYLYHCDPVFQAQVTSYVAGFNAGLIPSGAAVPIRRKDNVNITMTYAQLIQFSAALMQHVQAIYAQSWVEKDALP